MSITGIAVRVRRTVVEEVHVVVRVTDEVMNLSNPDQPELDVKAVFAKACSIAQEADQWRRESEVVEPHPLQTPLPPGTNPPTR